MPDSTDFNTHTTPVGDGGLSATLNDQLDATKGRVFELEAKIRDFQRRNNRGCGCLVA